MKLAPDAQADAWLRDLEYGPEDFDWDKGNSTKNAKHGVEDDEIESIFSGEFAFAGRIVEPDRGEWRGLALGRSERGRHLALVFTRRADKLRPISCRPMRQEERRLYEEKVQRYS